mmetsp:Transcript_1552/g.2692  ORF Transcript_1552/g.2692 Transcript_1552/m.2692 type:complete len:80 (-) Transcript_1552:523-762(-)
MVADIRCSSPTKDSTNSPLIGLQGFIPTALQRSAQDGDVVPSQAIGSQSLVAPSNRDALPSLDVTFTKCLFAVSHHSYC